MSILVMKNNVMWVALCALVLQGMVYCSVQVLETGTCVSRLYPLTEEQTAELRTLAALTGIGQHDSLKDFVMAVQDAEHGWLRPADEERWEVTNKYSAEVSAEIVACCKRLGMFDARWPRTKNFNYLCVLGATLPTVHKRVDFAVELWKNGVRWDKWVLLTGDRPLDEDADMTPLVPELPSNETNGMMQLFEQLRKNMPPDLQQVPVIVIHTLQKPDVQGICRRPNTVDTIREFLTMHPEAKEQASCFCSNQPFVLRQGTIVAVHMSPCSYCETVGPVADASGYIDRPHILLDEIARWLYVLCKSLDTCNEGV